MNIYFSLSPDQINYLRSSARIRQVSKGYLLCALIGKILDDQLVLAVMDDADEYPAPLPKPGDGARERKRMIVNALNPDGSITRARPGVLSDRMLSIDALRYFPQLRPVRRLVRPCWRAGYGWTFPSRRAS